MAPRSRPAIRKSIIKPGNAHRQGKASVHKKPEKKSSPGKCLNQIFNGLVFVLLGDFGDNLPHSKVGHYIELRGGTVARHVTKDTTFLISSLAKYTEKVLEGLYNRFTYQYLIFY
jgi:NAD-dependent DNA ligase